MLWYGNLIFAIIARIAEIILDSICALWKKVNLSALTCSLSAVK